MSKFALPAGIRKSIRGGGLRGIWKRGGISITGKTFGGGRKVKGVHRGEKEDSLGNGLFLSDTFRQLGERKEKN